MTIDECEDLPLFAKPKAQGPAVDNNPKKVDLREAAAQWISEHPKACEWLLSFARILASRQCQFGIGLLVERLRWEGVVEGWGDGEYKVSNNHRAYIARWLIAQDPNLERYLKFRKVHY